MTARRKLPGLQRNVTVPLPLARKIADVLAAAMLACAANGREDELRALGAVVMDRDVQLWHGDMLALKVEGEQ